VEPIAANGGSLHGNGGVDLDPSGADAGDCTYVNKVQEESKTDIACCEVAKRYTTETWRRTKGDEGGWIVFYPILEII
jgi:hypothetical protein